MSRLLRTRRFVWILALGLLTALSIAGYFSGRRYLDATDWVTHTFEVTETIDRVLSYAQDLENHQRGFLLSGDEAFLEPYEVARDRLPRELWYLSDLTRDNGEQQERVERLDDLIREKVAFMDRTIQQKQAGGDFTSLVRTGEGLRLMNDIRERSAEMRAIEKKFLAERAERAAGAQRNTILFSLFGVCLTLGLGLFSLATVHRDLREVREITEELAIAEKMFRELAENTSELVLLMGADGRPGYVSPSVERLLGFTPDEFLAMDPTSQVIPEDLPVASEWALGIVQEGKPPTTLNLRYRTKEGHYRWFEVSASVLHESSPAPPRVLYAGRDVHERRLAQEALEQKTGELQELSATDALTGLLNRRGFMERAFSLLEAARLSGRPLAIVFIDLDGLKPINDQLGHEAGDRAISEASRVLKQTVRGGDLVARLGGDEFAVLARELTEAGYEHFRHRVESNVESLNAESKRPFRLAFSIGAAFFDANSEESLESLLKRADAAMYEEKTRRKAARA